MSAVYTCDICQKNRGNNSLYIQFPLPKLQHSGIPMVSSYGAAYGQANYDVCDSCTKEYRELIREFLEGEE